MKDFNDDELNILSICSKSQPISPPKHNSQTLEIQSFEAKKLAI